MGDCASNRSGFATDLGAAGRDFPPELGRRLSDLMLARRTDKQSREQIRQRWVIVPVTDQASQQIWAPQEGTFLRSWAADYHVVAAACAGVLSVQHEFLRAQTTLAREFVKRSSVGRASCRER